MKDMIRKLAPQWIKNTFEHFPIAVLSNLIYGFPSRRLKIIGVTGTDGKTTTVNMIYGILKDAGKKVSMVSTINASIGGRDLDTGFHVTSPSSGMIQALIRKAKKAGDEYLVLEVTSHALDQHRFWGIKFDVGIVTNITHEHLDYHQTFEKYRAAKAKLIKNTKFTVLNMDDKNFDFLKRRTSGKVISFGRNKKADFNLKDYPLKFKIPGDFNKLNALATASAASVLGIDKATINRSLNGFSNLSGRMEEVKNSRGVRIFIDFAHTPNALENALKVLRVFKGREGRVIAVFGSAGYRDKGKRPMMGEIAAKLAEKVIITAEDPRGLIEEINRQILEGVKRAKGKIGEDVFVITDRQEAINMAINSVAKKGDIIGIFGKGHERSLNLDGKKELPWSDRGAVLKALNDK